jgi:hypothetical protein
MEHIYLGGSFGMIAWWHFLMACMGSCMMVFSISEVMARLKGVIVKIVKMLSHNPCLNR